MTTNPFRDRRRSERFAQLLEEAGGGRRQHLRTPYDEELTELVSVRHQLVAEDSAPQIDSEFRTGLRAMLVATAEREGIGETAQPETGAQPAPAAPAPTPAPAGPGRRARFPQGPRARTAVIAGVAVGAVAFTGMSAASENAMPGDALYGVKRSTERAQLALASSEVGRGQLYLEFAETRLAEARTLPSDLARVLSDMDGDTSHGVRLLTTAAANRDDRAALEVIDGFVRDQREALRQLAGEVPDAEQDRVANSIALLDAIEERADELRTSLDRDCGAVASIDALGPVPADCVSLPAPGVLDAQTPLAEPAPPGPPEQGRPDASHPEDGAVHPHPAPTDSGDDPAPGAESGEDGDAAVPGLPTDDPATDDPATEDGESSPDGDDDVLDGFNRVLGKLLGD